MRRTAGGEERRGRETGEREVPMARRVCMLSQSTVRRGSRAEGKRLTHSGDRDRAYGIDLIEIKPSPSTPQGPKLPILPQQLPHPPPELREAQQTKNARHDSEYCIMGQRGAVPEAVHQCNGKEA